MTGRIGRLLLVLAGVFYVAAIELIPFWSAAQWFVLAPLAALMAVIVVAMLGTALRWAWTGSNASKEEPR